MRLMRLKTAPRIVIGLALVGALGYGVNYYIDHRPKPAPAPTIDQLASQPAATGVVQADVLPVQAPVQPVQAPVAEAQPAPQPAPAQPAPRTQSDAALNALLKGGTK